MSSDDFIEVIGAQENNLKNVDVKIPKNKLVVVTGVSGSGKSSLILDIIAKEAKRQLYSTFSNFVRSRMEKIQKPKFEIISGLQTTIVIDQKRIQGNARSTVGTITDIYDFLRLLFSRTGNPQIGDSTLFSFNSPLGMCPTCKGLGFEITVHESKVFDKTLSLNDGAILHPDYKPTNWYFHGIKKCKLFNMDKPLKDFSADDWNKFLYSEPVRISKEKFKYEGNFEGVIRNLERRYLSASSKTTTTKKNSVAGRNMEFFQSTQCRECLGARLNEKARNVKYRGRTMKEICDLEITDLAESFREVLQLPTCNVIEKKIIRNLLPRLTNIVDLGIGYLSMSRKTPTLSGGEAQRIKISKQMNCSLVNIVYVLDEPSIGLHPVQIEQMVGMLKNLREKGNSVIVIEHEQSIMVHADWIIEMGPLAGSKGGEIMFQGEVKEYIKNCMTVNAEFLREYVRLVNDESEDDDDDDVEFEDKEEVEEEGEVDDIDIDEAEEEDEFLEIRNANENNLKNVSCRIPKNKFTAITGVAGSGKTTLIIEHFCEHSTQKCCVVNQFKITKSVRSNPATYTGCFSNIRKLFAKTNKKKIGLFSFNSKGACGTCKGLGFLKIEMHFLDDARTKCPDCSGKRFKDDVLEYKYKKKNIFQVLDMTVDDAVEFFNGQREILRKIQLLADVGLGYLKLGQSLSTLSGGESQRIKLANSLNKGGEIYILDEPSLGLSSHDMMKLLDIISTLKRKGNTVIVIEHNMEIVKHADYIIDLGPEGGGKGGEILFQGPVKGIVQNDIVKSQTAKYLKMLIKTPKRGRLGKEDDLLDDDDDKDEPKKKRRKL